jgi:hypothetical protein
MEAQSRPTRARGVRVKEPTKLELTAAQGRIVAELAEHKLRAPDWAVSALAQNAMDLALIVLPKASDPDIATQVLALAAELVAGAYADTTKWRDPPEDGWPRGEHRRKRLGAIAEAIAYAAALATPELESLPAKLRHRAVHLARAAVVLLARADPEAGSRLLAPGHAALVLSRSSSSARAAHEMGQTRA